MGTNRLPSTTDRVFPPYSTMFITRVQIDLLVYFVNIVYMNDIVHARLDSHTRRIMRQLKRHHGWSDSDIVRQAIRALGDTDLPPGQRNIRIIGLGKFASGITDLGSNDKHLHDFGR